MTHSLQAMDEWHDVDLRLFREEIMPRYRPAVLRGVVRNWKAVEAARGGPDAICDYFAGLDIGRQVSACLVRPEYGGHQFYNADMSGLSFARDTIPLAQAIEQVRRYSRLPSPPSVAVQGADIADCVPQFLAENVLSVVASWVKPKLWIGNHFIVPTHCDETSNVACVAGGRRRFTLFPPEQLPNLYIGPLEFTPTGPPVSMVQLNNPDFARYPKFRDALDAAVQAVLEPGDAVFIPPFWWHHVESLDKVNILVNYWWKEPNAAQYPTGTMSDCLYHCLLNLKDLPLEERQAIGVFFNHYLFNAVPDTVSHIPDAKRGVLGQISPSYAQQIKGYLTQRLK
ncbi:MAG TPA: cupin-like domain-containing protein [Burkholderiaceae bacterium]